MSNQKGETRQCVRLGKYFVVTQSDADFYAKISPKFGEYTAEIPYPTLCPEERLRRRMAFRNERKLYRRMCDATKQPIISIYSPDKKYIVFNQKAWWGDSRSGLEYGREFDFSKTFTEQFQDLMRVVPRLAIMNDDGIGSENCGYCQDFAFGKNCYMCTGSWHLEECLYSSFEACDSTYLVDCISIAKSHHCYACCYCAELYACTYLERSTSCTDCAIGFDLIGCTDCIACYGLRNQQYCYQNKQLTKEEFFQVKEKVYTDLRGVHEKFLEHIQQLGLRETTHHVSCEESTGQYLFNCDNVRDGYGTHNSKDCAYLFGGDQLKDCHDIIISGGLELGYEGVTPDEGYRVLFSTFTWKSKYCLYTDLCQSCSDCFGCIGLKNKQYCIFNKQYTKEEYERLVPQIIEHMRTTKEWGEFFDPSLSPWGYNETVAQEHFPISQSGSAELGRNWSNYESPVPQSTKVIDGKDLPKSIGDSSDDILNYAIRCSRSGKLFRLQPKEFVFYKKHGIPLPHMHPDERYLQRLTLRK